MSSRPSSDREYSTDGGDVGITARKTTPFSSRSRRRAVSILGEMPGMSRCSSPKRRGSPESFQMRLGVQAPPSTAMQAAIGQPGGGGGALLLRTLRANCRLLRGYPKDSRYCALREGTYYKKVSTNGNLSPSTEGDR